MTDETQPPETPEPRPTRAQAFIDLCGGPTDEHIRVGTSRPARTPKKAPSTADATS